MYYEFLKGAMLPVPEESAWEKCKERSGKEMGYSVFPAIQAIFRDKVQPIPMVDYRWEISEYIRRKQVG